MGHKPLTDVLPSFPHKSPNHGLSHVLWHHYSRTLLLLTMISESYPINDHDKCLLLMSRHTENVLLNNSVYSPNDLGPNLMDAAR